MAILGISAHKTTIYHSQSVNLLNNGWMPDPVQTAAMQGIVTGSDPSKAVQGAIESGIGYNLRQYYPYATKRFKKRNCEWSFAKLNSESFQQLGMDKSELLEILPELRNKEVRIVHDSDYFSYSGSKSFQDMEVLYNWNDFSPELSNGTNIVIHGAESPYSFVETNQDLKNTWVVGIETSKNIPVVILDPSVDTKAITSDYYLLAHENYYPEESAGLVYWASNNGFEPSNISNRVIERYTAEAFKLLNISGLGKEETNRITNWKQDESGTVSINYANRVTDNTDELIPLAEPREDITIYYRELVNTIDLGNGVFEYEVAYWEESGVINYDSIGYVWATRTEESHAGVKDYFIPKDIFHVERLSSKTSKLFKFYPYLPIKEYSQDILNYGNTSKYLNALKRFNDGFAENTSDVDAPKANRNAIRSESKKSRNSTKDGRIVSNKTKYTRKMKPKQSLGLDKSDDRHLVKMGQLLNTDYKELSSSLAVNPDYNKIYHASTIPAVTLGSNFDEVNNYWFKFFEKLLKKLPNSYDEFKEAVNQLPTNCTLKDTLNLPRLELSYGITNGQFGGFISFAYIQRFTISGSIRKTDKKKRLKEVICGLHTKLYGLSGEELKQSLINPSKERINNKYYTSPVSGKQYNIGEGKQYTNEYIPPKEDKFIKLFRKKPKPAEIIKQDSDKAYLMFSEFGYTFFAKDIGNNQLDVIAVAGLIGGQTRTGYVEHNHGSTNLDGATVAGRALQELNMFWARNRKRYIEKVLPEKIDIKTVFTSGSRRKKLETNIQTFFLIPLDYRIVSRMSGIDLMRLANRAVVTVNWVKVRWRRLREWVKVAVQVIGIIVTIVGAYYGDFGSTGLSILAIVKAIAIAVAVQLAVRLAVRLLIRVLGFKGFLALLLAIVIIVVAMIVGNWNNVSSLPYASQTASAQLATNISAQTVQQTATQSIFQNLKTLVQDTIKNSLNELSQMTATELLQNTGNLVAKLANEANSYLAEENKKIAERLKEVTSEYEQHMGELEYQKELNQERTAPYDVKLVMESLSNKTKLIDPTIFLNMSLLSDNILASEEFLSQFIGNKLNLEPSTFDSIASLDYSLTM